MRSALPTRSAVALAMYVYLSIFASPETAFGGPVSADAGGWYELHYRAIEATKSREFEVAADLFRESAKVAQNAIQRGLSDNDLGVTLHQLVRDTEAKPYLENAFRIWRANPGQEARLSQTAEALAAVNRCLGDYQGAETALRTALLTPPADADGRALLLNELGDILREVGHSQEAHQLFEETLRLRNITPRRRADAVIGLADLDRDTHNWQVSFEGWNEAARIAREHQWVALEAAAVRGMGVTYLDHGERARAEPLLRRSLALFESQDVPGHQISSTLTCLGQLYFGEGKYGMAEDALQRALAIGEKSLGENHPQMAVILEMLGDVAVARKQLELGRHFYQRARLIMAARFGDHSPMAAAVDASWAMNEQRAKHNAEAAEDYERALAILSAAGPDLQGLRNTITQHYAEVCKALHRKTAPMANGFLPQTNQVTMPQSK